MLKKLIYSGFILLLVSCALQAQTPALIGYWQNWQDGNSPYIQLTNTDASYNIIAVSFALTAAGTTYNMQFTPEVVTQQTFINQVATMKAAGKKVIISIGGETGQVALNDTNQRNIFISSMMNIFNTYGFDGMDIDIEGGNLLVTGGTISNPVDARIINLISGTKKLMQNFRQQFNKKMVLTMAPETAGVQGGMSAYGGIWGAYLPVINALRDSINVLHVQLYNSGSMYGIDGNVYSQGTADFILSQTEAVLYGFNTAGGYFAPLRQDQTAVGLPACTSAAGGGYIHPDTVKSAINYLRGLASKPAHYTKVNSYPMLRGMMTWSVNWDAQVNCHPLYAFARNFDRIFNVTGIYENQINLPYEISLGQNYPNPFNPTTSFYYRIKEQGKVTIKIYDQTGKEIAVPVDEVKQPGQYVLNFNAKDLPSGVYLYIIQYEDQFLTKKMMLVK
jgi:chitinase